MYIFRGERYAGVYLPSTNATENKVPESEQAIVLNSLLNDHSLSSPNMNPGQMYFITHFIIYLSKK